MPDPIIRAENVSKTFRISHGSPERYVALRDVIARKARGLFARGGKVAVATSEDFHALRDITFDVAPGDRIGIIGRNGAGKSTLLKMLSRITEPTTGRIRLRGRVASCWRSAPDFIPS